MIKMHVSVDIDLEKFSRDGLNELRDEIDKEIALREVIKTDSPKFQTAYYTGLIERFGKYRAIMRYMDDMKCTGKEARDYIEEFVVCQRCGKYGGYVRKYKFGSNLTLLGAGWVCPHCGIPPLPEYAVEE